MRTGFEAGRKQRRTGKIGVALAVGCLALVVGSVGPASAGTLSSLQKGDEFVRYWGDAGDVDVGIIAFGSTEGVIREASDRARAEGYKVSHLHLRMLNPLPVAPPDA